MDPGARARPAVLPRPGRLPGLGPQRRARARRPARGGSRLPRHAVRLGRAGSRRHRLLGAGAPELPCDRVEGAAGRGRPGGRGRAGRRPQTGRPLLLRAARREGQPCRVRDRARPAARERRLSAWSRSRCPTSVGPRCSAPVGCPDDARQRRRLAPGRRPARLRRGGPARPRRASRPAVPPRAARSRRSRVHDRPRARGDGRARRRPAAGRMAAHRRARHRPPPGPQPARPGPRRSWRSRRRGTTARSRCRSPDRGRWRRPSSGRAATRCWRTPAPDASSRRRWPRGSPSTSPTCAAGCRAGTGWSSRSTSPR